MCFLSLVFAEKHECSGRHIICPKTTLDVVEIFLQNQVLNIFTKSLLLSQKFAIIMQIIEL